MKALAAPYNQQAISELIFHPAIVMSSPGAGIIHNSPCYDKLRPRAREVYERFRAPCQVHATLCWSNRSGLVGGSCEIGSGIKQEIGQVYLNTMWRHEMNGFLTLVAPQCFPLSIIPSHHTNALLTDTTSRAPTLLFLKIVGSTATIITVIYKILSIRYQFHCCSRVDGPVQKWAGDLWNLTNAISLSLSLI